MLPGRSGSFHLFRLLGIDVFLNWSWFLIPLWFVDWRHGNAASHLWDVFEFLALFTIVLMHEFGHALACRGVGGKADQIVLWPFGGVAYVDPPQRPGAVLWSIAAGPLVNALLFPVLTVLSLLCTSLHWDATVPNLGAFIYTVWRINVGLFCFNMLPVYPLDGGQILRSLLWYAVGPARSLMIASTIGLTALGLFLVAAVLMYFTGRGGNLTWLILIGGIAASQCWNGLQQARIMSRIAAAPRQAGAACPSCHQPPPVGEFWVCSHCQRSFDMFANRGACPHCGVVFNGVRCLECGAIHPVEAFFQ